MSFFKKLGTLGQFEQLRYVSLIRNKTTASMLRSLAEDAHLPSLRTLNFDRANVPQDAIDMLGDVIPTLGLRDVILPRDVTCSADRIERWLALGVDSALERVAFGLFSRFDGEHLLDAIARHGERERAEAPDLTLYIDSGYRPATLEQSYRARFGRGAWRIELIFESPSLWAFFD